MTHAYRVQEAWATNTDKPLYVDCPAKQALYGVRSYHNNRKEDRHWRFYCRRALPIPFTYCYWTGHVNAWDWQLLFQCPANYIMTGVSSYHHSSKEDRRWKFKCYRANSYYTKSCSLSGYINQWDKYVNHYARYNKFFVGALSVHRNKKEYVTIFNYVCTCFQILLS